MLRVHVMQMSMSRSCVIGRGERPRSADETAEQDQVLPLSFTVVDHGGRVTHELNLC